MQSRDKSDSRLRRNPAQLNMHTQNETFNVRVKAIRWCEYETAYGKATPVAKQLIRLNSNDHDTAMHAAHELWSGLCHQIAYVSSAALPAFPFILEVFDTANDELTVEILDMLAGFAVCTAPHLSTPETEAWMAELRKQVFSELPRFENLTRHQNEDIRHFAELAVHHLTNTVG